MSNTRKIEVLAIEERKRRNLKKKVKKAIKYKVIGNTKENLLLVKDINFMYEDLMDFLLLDPFTNKREYIEAINAFLYLECKAFEYKTSLTYTIGAMFELIKIILFHHESIGLKNKT